ncbi:MAG: hypothetical protein AAEJ16_02200, partial [Arenicellales bacterium]
MPNFHCNIKIVGAIDSNTGDASCSRGSWKVSTTDLFGPNNSSSVPPTTLKAANLLTAYKVQELSVRVKLVNFPIPAIDNINVSLAVDSNPVKSNRVIPS